MEKGSVSLVKEPLISVVITAYNRKEFIKRAVESVLTQTLERSKYELIVVKNFVDEEIDAYLEENGVRITQIPDCTMGFMFDAGVQASEGTAICFLEDDDLFMPTKLAKIYDVFTSNPSVGYYKNVYKYVDVDGQDVRRAAQENFVASFAAQKELYVPNSRKLEQVRKYSSIGADMNMSSMCIRKDAINNVREYFLKINDKPDAFVFAAALISKYDLYFDREIESMYRLYSFSTSRDLRSYPVEHAGKLILRMIRDKGLSRFSFFFRQKQIVTRILTFIELGTIEKRKMVGTLLDFVSNKRTVDPVSDLWALKFGAQYLISPSWAERTRHK